MEKTKSFPDIGKKDVLSVLTTEPADSAVVEKLAFASDHAIIPVKSENEQIEQLLSQNVDFTGETTSRYESLTQELKKNNFNDILTVSTEELKKSGQAEPVIKMVDLLLEQAITSGASDIHIEPYENFVVIRNRIDGSLIKSADFPLWMNLPLTSRIKILADMDIAEKRLPQDGRIKREYNGIPIDMRVSTLPTHFGEKTVIRILRHTDALFSLDHLGFTTEQISSIDSFINRPQGMIFVTGPTGSGKSSSLFAFLNRIKGKTINITTIENPIEIKLPGINQVQVNEKSGLTFAETLRSILRQDPDIILIGEIRDNETASIAVRAAQTGHLVFSTLHTNDAVSAITRLRDLKVEPFLIASSVMLVLAQRLVRKLCVHCKEIYTPDDNVLFRFRHVFGSSEFPQSYIGRGCKLCNNTGYGGRIGIFEFLIINNRIRQMIIENKSETEIKAAAISEKMAPLAESGLEKVKAGITSMDELLKVVAF